MYHVGFLHHVFLAFKAPFAYILRALLAVAGYKIVKSDYLGANKTLFEIGMDLARCTWRGITHANSPGPHFLRASGEVGLQVQQLITGMDYPVEPWFFETHFL